MDWCDMFSLEINCETQEIIERPYTEEEISEAKIEHARVKAEAQKFIEQKAQRQALLDKLGITEEEARLLLGGN